MPLPKSILVRFGPVKWQNLSKAPDERIYHLRIAVVTSAPPRNRQQNKKYFDFVPLPPPGPNRLPRIPRQGIMLLTNEKVTTVPPKTTTMHDYFKPDSKKAADKKRGRRLNKRKSIANESIDLDRGRPSKCRRHSADRAARGLAPSRRILQPRLHQWLQRHQLWQCRYHLPRTSVRTML